MDSHLKDRGVLESARKFFAGKNYREAIELCEQAIAAGSQLDDLFLLCGTAALYANDLETASRHADAVLNKDFNNAKALVLKALAIRNIDPQRALALLDRALRFSPQSQVIQEYRYRILSKMYDQTTLNLTEPFAHSRKWLRAKIKRDVQLPGASNNFKVSKTISLSGGGCLIEAKGLPEQFQFTLQLKELGKVWGLAEVSYVEKDRFSGIRFLDLSAREQGKIDYEVRLMAQ